MLKCKMKEHKTIIIQQTQHQQSNDNLIHWQRKRSLTVLTIHSIAQSIMQKRRVNIKTSDQLPVTIQDTQICNSRSSTAAAARAERRANRKNKKNDAVRSLLLFVIFMILLGFILLTDFDYVSHHPIVVSQLAPLSDGVAIENSSSSSAGIASGSGRKRVVDGGLSMNGSLSKFPSLKYALENSDLVGVYFAASWCSMSTPISNKIEELFSVDSSPLSHRVLSPSAGDGTDEITTRKEFSLVYVSSDDNEMEMMDYTRSNWIPVPFDSPDRTNIKQHFRICAQVEMESLGIERRRQEIPSLVIIESATQGILSMGGKDDLLQYGEDVLDHWISQKDLVRTLEE